MSIPLNQPKWKKFLALKRQRHIIKATETYENGEEPSILQSDAPVKLSMVEPSPTKKRKRTEEEIALRKAKKLKSKNKDSQEWKQLSEEHKSNLSAEPNGDTTNSAPGNPDMNGEQPPETESSSDASASLLAAKAKEIARVRREEKLQDKQTREKPPKYETSDLEQKAIQVLQYLEDYRSHVKSGAEWKFKKQYQNWIVKHLYTYMWENDELVIMYLQSIEGQARQRLAVAAKERIEKNDDGESGEIAIRRAERVLKALG
jgi:hypothetical protein